MELDETDVRNAWNRRESGVEFALGAITAHERRPPRAGYSTAVA
jgi:hypothetical protein